MSEEEGERGPGVEAEAELVARLKCGAADEAVEGVMGGVLEKNGAVELVVSASRLSSPFVLSLTLIFLAGWTLLALSRACLTS